MLIQSRFHSCMRNAGVELGRRVDDEGGLFTVGRHVHRERGVGLELVPVSGLRAQETAVDDEPVVSASVVVEHERSLDRTVERDQGDATGRAAAGRRDVQRQAAHVDWSPWFVLVSGGEIHRVAVANDPYLIRRRIIVDRCCPVHKAGEWTA